MLLHIDFIKKLLGLQDIKVSSVNVNNGTIEIYAELKYSLAVCPKCRKLSSQVHDHRIQPYRHCKIQAIFNHYAKEFLESRQASTPVYFGIDDIAVLKGHNYLTVVYNQVTGSIIDIFHGRTTEIVNCFPNADVVIDRFHVSQHLHNQIDEARKHIQNKVRKETGNKSKVFGIRWALLKNFEDLTYDHFISNGFVGGR